MSSERRVLRGILLRALAILIGLGLTLILLAGIELTLSWLDLGRSGRPPHFFAAYSNHVAIFERHTRDDGIAVYRTKEPARTRVPSEFLVEKPDDGFRVFVVGGSSAAGTPYGHDYAFGAWLERRLTAALPSRTVEVANAAQDAYASRRVLAVVRELARYEPDLLVVYSGHNELAEYRLYGKLTRLDPRLFRLWSWLANTRMYGQLADAGPLRWVERLVREEQLEFDQGRNALDYFANIKRRAKSNVSDEREGIYQEIHYRRNLEEMIRAMREVGAGVLLATLSQNFADWPPGASWHREGLSDAERTEWEEMVREGDRDRTAGECERALEHYRRALAIDPDYAALHYDIAKCERTLKRYDSAYVHFRRASDLDRVPNGAYTRMNDLLRQLAGEHETLLVDIETRLEEASPHRLVGNNLFVDLVHPNLHGHQIMAEAIADTMREGGFPEPSELWRDAGYADAPVDALYADTPRLRLHEHTIRAAACFVTGRGQCATESVDAVLAMDPDHEAALRIHELLRAQKDQAGPES